MESRIAPAIFSGAGGPGLNIVLDHSGESIVIVSTGTTYTVTSNFTSVDGGSTNGGVAGFGTTVATIQADAYATIHISDLATSAGVSFGASGANAYTSSFDIELTGLTAGVTFAGASTFNGGLTAKVPGSITQAAPIIAQSNVSLTSTGGAITLTDAGNNFSTLSLETSGANAINVRTSGTLTLVHVKTETGNLTITAGSGIGQSPSELIDVGGTATFDITGGVGVALDLSSAMNFFGGPVVITESGGDLASVAVRNVSPTAALPNLTDLAAGDLSSLTLFFDGRGIVIDAATETTIVAGGTLNVTAGGPITQSAPITVGALNVTALGNNGITLTNPANDVSGAVSLNNHDADAGAASAVSYVEGAGVTLGNSSLGLGTLSVTALSGNITETGAIAQRIGAGTASFTASAGTTIDLATKGNIFAGPVHFGGVNVSDVHLRDLSQLASVPNLTAVSTALTSLTLIFDNAPVVLPTYTATNLNVTANGIYQQPSTKLVVPGNAQFNAGAFKIDLTNALNDFGTLQLNSVGAEDVSVVDVNALAFGAGNSILGTGRLTVAAGGPITQPANQITQAAAAGPASFSGASIVLDRTTNNFTGEVLLSTSGPATVVDTNSIVLGRVNVAGDLTVLAVNNITQAPGSTLTVAAGHVATFDSGAGASLITLDNPGNAVSASVRFTDGNVTFRNTAGVNFSGTSAVASLDVTAGGAISSEAAGLVTVTGKTNLDAGANPITLTNAANNFQGAVSLASTGAVSITDLNAIQFGNVKLGAAAFTVTANGNLTQVAGTAITQTGPGAITFAGGAANNVTLTQAGNDFHGTLSVDANGVNVTSRGDIHFTTNSDIDGGLTLHAGGVVTLPIFAGNLSDLNTVNISGSRIIVGGDLGTDAGLGVIFNGAVEFASGATVNTSAVNGPVTFNGNVTAAGPLTFKVGSSQVSLNDGTWNQGANNLTITSTGTSALQIGAAAIFAMSGGTLDLNVAPGGDALIVKTGGTFKVGTVAGTAETVTIDTGGVNTNVHFMAGFPQAGLQVGFGATNDRLVVNGIGDVLIDGARLIGSGLAAAAPTPVLAVTGGGAIVGFLDRSVSADGTSQPFLAGSDIVAATQTPAAISIGQGGTVSATGTVSGFLFDGSKFSVTHSAGGAAGLVVIEDNGLLEVAVRNNAAAGTLTISSTPLSGAGVVSLGGIGVNGPGAITIAAATSNTGGDIRVEGPLASLTLHDVGASLIQAGGPASDLTSITAHHFFSTQIELAGVLNKLTLAEYNQGSPSQPATVLAERIGTVKITGDPAAGFAGNLEAHFSNRNALGSPAPALGSATVAGNLTNTWDLAGTIGPVSAKTANEWVLGPNGAGTLHPGGVTSTGALSLGEVDDVTINVTGAIPSVKATDWGSSDLTAGSIGTFAITGNAAASLTGDFAGSALTITGNAVGYALKTLSVLGVLDNSTLHFLNGNVGSINVGREVSDSSIFAADTSLGGRLGRVTAARWNNTDLDAESVGSLTVKGNSTDGLFGDMVASHVTLRGASAGLALGTLSLAGQIDTVVLRALTGSVKTIAAGREMMDSSIVLSDPLAANLTSISAASFDTLNLSAKSIGTFKATGAPQVSPASPLIIGDVTDATIVAFQNASAAAAVGKFSATGGLSGSTVTAHHGITSFTVWRTVSTSAIVADDLQPGQAAVGRIGAWTVGSMLASTLSATTIGKLGVTGFTMPETGAVVAGDVASSTILADAPGGSKAAIDSVNVAGSVTNSDLIARAGSPSVTVKGSLTSFTTLVFDNPLDLATSGKLGTATFGFSQQLTLRANSIGSLNFTGNFESSDLAVAGSTGPASDPVAVSTFSVAGNLNNSHLDIPAGVKNFKVSDIVISSDVAAGFGPNARIGSLSAGVWLNSDLTTSVLSSMSVTGHAATGFPGLVSDSLFTITGNNAGVGIGTFVAKGLVVRSTFQVTDGSVTSFTAGRFIGSDLYAGFRPASAVDLTQSGTFALTDRTIGLFKTTEPFDPADPDSASFAQSNIVAAKLGPVTLLGVDPAADRPTVFGVGFKTGGTAGPVKADVGAGLVTVTAPFDSGAFTFRGL